MANKTKKKSTKNKDLQNIQIQSPISQNWANDKSMQDAVILANEYFNGVKSKKEQITAEAIKKELDYLPQQIEELTSIGQTGLANKLKHDVVNITKERILLNNGFDTYVHRRDVLQYIRLVKDKKVHIVELALFPRVIPNEPREILKKAQSLKLFSDFWVLYVDYSDDNTSVMTDKQKEERKKNRDPIIFGTFDKPENAELDKMFFICDWEDEYCDLTLDKMVKELVEKDNPNYKPEKIIKDIDKYINNLIKEDQKTKKSTFSEKVMKFFGLSNDKK